MRKAFGRQELDGALSATGGHLKRPVIGYLIGGCAMTFQGQKIATKDIDLVVLGPDDLEALVAAMEVAGFVRVPDPGDAYRQLGARYVLQDPSGMRFDIFEKVVCRKLAFSLDMQRRSTEEATFSSLTVRIASAEDIFLFKGVTDRPDDLDDMSVLAIGGLDWATIKAECLSQESGHNWASHLVGKLEELEEKYDIVAPITVELRKWAEVHAMGAVVSTFIGGRQKSFKAIRDYLRAKYQFTDAEAEEELSRLVRHQVLLMRRRGGTRYYRRRT